MKPYRMRIGVCWRVICFITIISLNAISVNGAFLYKSYIVRKDHGKDVLCDPYIVQKDDYVLKIFRQRGQIAHEDFPNFLKIFGRINPHIHNLDKILPGQHIFIPLKILAPNSLEGQELGVVTIPFVTISDIHTILKNNSKTYKVAGGDTVSRILSTHFSRYGTQTYEEGLRMFKAMNPQITDINRIYAGQEILLPQRKIQNEPWYESLFDPSGNLVQTLDTNTTVLHEKGPDSISDKNNGDNNLPSGSPLEQTAQLFGGKLFQKGVYYFPRPGQRDLQLDMTRYPVLELPSGTRILMVRPETKGKPISDANLSAIKNYWDDLTVVSLHEDATFKSALSSIMAASKTKQPRYSQFFNDQGVTVTVQCQWMIDQPDKKRTLGITVLEEGEERTPRPIVDYLKTHGIVLKEFTDHGDTSPTSSIAANDGIAILDANETLAMFIDHFYNALEIDYAPNVSITFPYAGAQIQAISNIVNKSDGGATLIDFGTLYGDAIQAIESSGIQVLQISEEEAVESVIPKLIDASGMTCNVDPTFSAAHRNSAFNTSITVPGYLAQRNETPIVLFAAAPLSSSLLTFFHHQGIEVIGLSGIQKSKKHR